LFFPGDSGDDGGGPIVVACAGDGPLAFAIFCFKGGDGAVFFGSDDDDEGVFVEDGSGAVAELIGGEIVACDVTGGRDGGDFNFFVVLEDDEDVGSVPLSGLGSGAVFFVKVFWVAALVDDFFPEDFSGFTIEGDE